MSAKTRKSTGRAPDFTKACVVMSGIYLSWIFFAIWTIWASSQWQHLGGASTAQLT